jgi:hypothetical protein
LPNVFLNLVERQLGDFHVVKYYGGFSFDKPQEYMPTTTGFKTIAVATRAEYNVKVINPDL